MKYDTVVLFAISLLGLIGGYLLLKNSLNEKLVPYESVVYNHRFEGESFEFSFNDLPSKVSSASVSILLEGVNSDTVNTSQLTVASFTVSNGKFDTIQLGQQRGLILTVELPTPILSQTRLRGSITFPTTLSASCVRVRCFGWAPARAKHIARLE